MAETDREKFLKQLALRMFPEQIKKIGDAYQFSKAGHKGQKRDEGCRYFDHPKAVARIITDELKLYDWRIIVTALLHDILEDSFIFNERRLIHNFGHEVTHWVILLTKKADIDYYERLRNCGVWEVLLVKLCDRLHNLRTLSCCAEQKKKKYIAETRREFIRLANILLLVSPQEQRERALYLKEQICNQLFLLTGNCRKPSRQLA